MMKYPFSKIQKLYTSLKKNKIEPLLIQEIMEGGEEIKASSSPMLKSEWFFEAMKRMDTLIDYEKRVQIRESCACNLAGKRLQLSKEIYDPNATFEEKICIANETKLIFGHCVELMKDGKIKVQFQPENISHATCSCLPWEYKKISLTYCYCCGGYVKQHLQNILGESLKCTVISSALNSGGDKPCTFILESINVNSV